MNCEFYNIENIDKKKPAEDTEKEKKTKHMIGS